MKPACLLACMVLVAASLATFPVAAQTSIAEQQDARVIQNLRSNGADVSKVHDIDFILIFDLHADATDAAQELRLLGYKIVRVDKKADGEQWELYAKRKMVPELGAMQATTRALEAIAASHDGRYDGWGTIGVK